MAKIEPESVEEFRELAEEEEFDALDYWADRMAPKIENMIHVKKAVLLTVASHGDEYGDRGRIHTLLSGKPGTAKSMFRTWVAYKLDAETTDEASKVGLKGDARGEEITPGALPRANGGVLTVDELDEFSKRDRKGLLTAMEEGIISIEKGGMSAKFDARVRVIGCCNKTDNFSQELIDRFDFFFALDKPSKSRQQDILSKIADTWFKDKEGLEGKKLRNYLKWVKPHQPDISKDTREMMNKILQTYVQYEDDLSGIRHKQSVLRVAYTIAKLNKRELRDCDILRGIGLLDPDMIVEFESIADNGFSNTELADLVEKAKEKMDDRILEDKGEDYDLKTH